MASLVVLFLLTTLSCGLAPATALAGTAEEINSLPVLDSLNRTESPLSNGGKWSALAWATNSSGHATGQDTTSGWGPYDAFSAVNGAYWNPSTFSDANGSAAAITMQTSPEIKERYVSLWLDMTNPGSTKSGYQLRWRVLSSTTTYKVTLSKWSSGTETVLAEQASVEIATGTTMAISDTGSTVTAWKGTGGSLSSILSASDSAFSSGYAGMEGSGNNSRSKDFKAGALSTPKNPPDTTISSGPKGVVVPNVAFTFTASEQGATFECSLDGAAYSGCASPKAYQGLTEGSHTFRVRAIGAGGTDETPAERGFQVIQAVKAVGNVPILDNLERQEVPLATGKWSKTNWAGAIGGAWMGGYRGYGSSGGLAGAYWNPTSFSDGGETLLVAGNVGTGAAPEGQYLALWLDMPEPGSARSGYEARFTGVNGSASNYKVELSKWVSGARTVLASTSGFSLSVGTTMALTETSGGSLTLWTGTSSLSPILIASDSTYTSGYVGLEVNGPAGTIYNFRAGRLASPPDTTISAGPKGVVVPNVSFTFTASEQGATFECSLDGGSYSSCASPKAYQGLGEGAHTFRVRATNAAGADETPAERSFQVVQAGKAVTKVPILDNFEREEVPLATGKWLKSSWAGEIGGAWMDGYRGYGSNGGLAGAYWNPTSFSDAGETLLASGNVGTGSPWEGEYLALWLDMPSPGSARSGYEARFTGVNGSASNYKVELAKWVSNTRTVLASTSGFSLAVDTTMALTETPGGSLALWTGSTSLSPVLTANDSTYASGYAGLDVNGGAGTIYNFRAGRIDIQPPDTTITSGPSGKVSEASASFSFTSTESESTFECSLDGGSYAACASPKSYSGLTAGSHTFKVRAVDGVGNKDETPAERNFEVAQPPSATTAAAAEVKATSAILKGSVNPRGATTTYQFEYGTTTAYGNLAPATPKPAGSGTEAVEVSEPIAGLGKGTVYHYRLAATNSAGTTKGEDKTFTTTNVPLATTEAATNISATEATLNGTVNPKGAATTYWFEYGPTISYGAKVPATAEGVGSGESGVAVSKQISGLTEGNTYHYRVAASNEVGTTYGSDQAFEVLLLPTTATLTAGHVRGREAELRGTLNPNGQKTTYHFEYGTTTAYGTSVPLPAEEIGISSETGEVAEAVGGLEPNTQYHYRLSASSQAGSSAGADQTFTTGSGTEEEGEGGGAFEEPEEGKTYLAGSGSNDPLTAAFTSSYSGSLPANFVDLMWGGFEDTGKEMLAIEKYGAGMLRYQISYKTPAKDYESLFERAAKHGITILPYIYGDATQADPHPFPAEGRWGEYADWVETLVNKYGPGGGFWAGKSYAKPVYFWEVWNEPNRGLNNPNSSGVKAVHPALYGDFLQRMSNAISHASEGRAKTVMGGLLSVKLTGWNGEEFVMLPENFLSGMGSHGRDAYDALGLHPYAFTAEDGSAPESTPEVKQVVAKVKHNIVLARNGLNDVGGGGKKLWLTELGWPIEVGDTNHPAVHSQTIQAELLKYSFDMIKEEANNRGIRNVFYYNDRDNGAPGWDYHDGLRELNGRWRKITYAFEDQTNSPRWPKPAHVGPPRVKKGATSSSVTMSFDPQGVGNKVFARYGGTSSYGRTSGEVEPDFESPSEVTVQLTNLLPEHVYHFDVFAINENGEETETGDFSFETPPSTVTTATATGLNGEPGWASVVGWVKEGGDEGLGIPEGPNAYVNVIFEREISPEVFRPETEKTKHPVIHAGQYSIAFNELRLGNGTWRTQTFFPGVGEYEASHSNPHVFTIKNGYHLVNQNSGKCLEVSYGSSENGMSIHQEPCGDGHTQQAQAFTLVPSPSNPAQYEIVNRNSGKCLDVKDASQADGAQIQQYTCLGWGQANQVFEGVPVSSSDTSHVNYIAQHSHKCLDITGASTANGALLEQWSCNGGSNQAFGFESVEADPVPTTPHVTLDETLYGHPGYETLHGSVEAPQSVAGQYVNVNFKKKNSSGVYEYIDTIEPHPTLNGEGKFSYSYWGVGAGDWEVVVVYPGVGVLGESKTVEGTHRFHVGDGYRFEFRQSNKCVSTSGGGTSNGTAIIQWECDPNYNPSDGQVYSVKPMAPAGSNYFEVIPDSNTNMCLDVAGGPSATQNGATVGLWQCLGESQTNQIWHIVELASPNQGWFAFIAKHSSRCMTVSENSTANGARFLQWDCSWAGSQQWRWLPVG